MEVAFSYQENKKGYYDIVYDISPYNYKIAVENVAHGQAVFYTRLLNKAFQEGYFYAINEINSKL